MKTIANCVLLLFALCGLSTASAAPHAVVDAVQAPAWVERAAQRRPLSPGMVLENRDRLVTGSGGRIVVQLADGSAVKLGEEVLAGVNALQQSRQGLFNAAFDIARGAFRLTTDRFRRYQARRGVNVRVGAVTIGIRGTDVWGRSSGTQDLVCLLEGRVAVTHPLAELSEMDQAGQAYVAERGRAPQPLTRFAPEEIARLASETELVAAGGTQRQGGGWQLNFGRYDQLTVLALYDRLQAAGYAVRIRPVREGADYRYELRLPHLVSGDDARLVADRLLQHLHVPQAELIAPRGR